MFILLKDGQSEFVWDSKKSTMFHSDDGEVFQKSKMTLHALEKFRPTVRIVRRQKNMPARVTS